MIFVIHWSGGKQTHGQCGSNSVITESINTQNRYNEESIYFTSIYKLQISIDLCPCPCFCQFSNIMELHNFFLSPYHSGNKRCILHCTHCLVHIHCHNWLRRALVEGEPAPCTVEKKSVFLSPIGLMLKILWKKSSILQEI